MSLQYFHGSMEPNTERAVLIQACDPKSMSRYRGDAYPSIEFRVLRIDDKDEGYRWADWAQSKGPSYMVQDLVLRVFVSSPGRNMLTGFHVLFEPLTGGINYDTAERMHRTLKKLKARAETHPQAGNHVEVLIWVTDLMKSLGVNQFIGHKQWNDRADLDTPWAFEVLPHMRARMNHVKRIAEEMCGEALAEVA